MKTYSKEEQLLEDTKLVMDTIFNTRYSLDKVFEILSLSKYAVLEKLRNKEYIDNNFGEGMYDKLKVKITQNSSIRARKDHNESKIESAEMVSIVKPDLYVLNNYDFNDIKLVADYLKSEGNIKYVIKNNLLGKFEKDNYNDCYRLIVFTLGKSKLKDILSDEAYLKVKKYYNYEKLYSISFFSRQELCKKLHDLLESLDYDYETAFEITGMPKNLFYRILMDDYYVFKYAINNNEEKVKTKVNSK